MCNYLKKKRNWYANGLNGQLITPYVAWNKELP
jgi:hypothetical protein